MASLFGTPDVPQPDPKIQAMRDAEQQRAEDDRLRQTQLQLAQETARRRGVGIGSLLGPLGTNLSTNIGAG